MYVIKEAWEYVETCMIILPNEYCQMNISRCDNLVLYHMGLQRHENIVEHGEHGVAVACTISVQKQSILLSTFQLLLHIS